MDGLAGIACASRRAVVGIFRPALTHSRCCRPDLWWTRPLVSGLLGALRLVPAGIELITATTDMAADATLFQCVAACNGTQRFVGFVGGLLTVDIAKNIRAVARFCGGNSVPTATQAGEVALLELQAGSSGFKVIARATVALHPGCAGSDASGFVWADLPETVSLHPGKQYVLAAENKPGWKILGTSGQDMPQVSGDGVQVKPIYTSADAASVNAGTANWIEAGLPGSM